MRMRRKPNLIPRMERCEKIVIKTPNLMRGSWRSLYPECEKLALEIGCGKGRFTAETAAAEPKMFLVAMDRVADAMIIAIERVFNNDIPNAVFINGDASMLPEWFAPQEIERIYINFCDPWPAKRHAKRRLTSPLFLARYKEILAPDGEIHFKTDNSDLFEYSLEQFEENGFELFEVTRDLHKDGICGVMTDYEKKFHEQGIKINRCVAKVKREP